MQSYEFVVKSFQYAKVLIIEDDPFIRVMLTDILEDIGCETVVSDSGTDGLELLRSDFSIDLVITDFSLPGFINGSEMVEAARKVRSSLKALFITGYGDPGLAGGLNHQTHLIEKPFTLQTVEKVVKELLGASMMQ